MSSWGCSLKREAPRHACSTSKAYPRRGWRTSSLKASAREAENEPAGVVAGELSAVRRFTRLDPGLGERLGLVVRRIGAGDRDALGDTDGDELLQPLLLEG